MPRFKLSGYLTPDEIPVEVYCLQLQIPYNHIFIAAFLGALYELIESENWQKFGAVTPDEAAYAALEVIDAATDYLSCETAPTPYWDEESGDDADDEQPASIQDWFGQIQIIDDRLSFVDNLGIWIITGFVAYAATPAAAISFLPFARKFVLTFQNFSLGGLVRILADGVELLTVDTYSPTDSVQDVTVIMPEPAAALLVERPVLWVELTGDANPAVVGTPAVRVIRKRLSEAEVSPPDLRYNSECDCVEYTSDDGETWVRDDGDDPRVGVKFLKPLKTGIDIRCRTAASMVKWLRDFIEYEASIMTAGATVTAVANAAFSLFDIIAPWAVLIQLLIELAGTLFGIGAAALDAAFDDETWTLTLCVFYCYISNDGSVTDSQFLTVQTQLTAQLNTTAALVLNLILQTQGRVGFQNAGTLYEVEDADCSSCECQWCYEWDFTASDGGWAARTDIGTTVGHYVAGVGWQPNVHEDGCSQHAYTYLFLDIPEADNIATVEYEFASAIGDFDVIFFDQNTTGHSIVQRSALSNGVAEIHAADFTPVTCTTIEITINKCGAPAGWTQTKCRVKGFGDMPAFTGGGVCA